MRTGLTLGAGEWKTFTIPCDFEPKRAMVDPDVKVLQLRRRAAEAAL